MQQIAELQVLLGVEQFYWKAILPNDQKAEAFMK